jgi:hypothetical protein
MRFKGMIASVRSINIALQCSRSNYARKSIANSLRLCLKDLGVLTDVGRIDDSHFSAQFCRDRGTNISSSHGWPESPWRDQSGECFEIIVMTKRLSSAQTRGRKSAFKSSIEISVIL